MTRARSRHDASFRQLRKLTAKSARDDRQKYWSETATSMEQASNVGDTRKLYKIIRQPFTPFAQGTRLPESGFEGNTPLSSSDNQWDFGDIQSAPVPVAASNTTTDVPASFDGDDSEFGSFTSCEPNILPSFSTGPPPATPTPPASLAIPPTVAEERPAAQPLSPGIDDVFQDFQVCPVLEPETFKQTEDEGPLKDWLRCLDVCLTMLTDSEAVLSALTTDEGVTALLATPRGYEFIFELIEIYGIVQRIRMASTLYNVLNLRLQSTFKQIDKVWSNLAHFVKTDTHKAALRRLLTLPGGSADQGITEFTQPSVDDKQLCGVCVTPVTLLPNPIIELAGHVYHPSCANLWVNKIQLSLPALCRP